MGALHKLFEPLSRNNIGMTRIESLSSCRGMWDYVYFGDIEGHADNADVAKALDELDQVSSMVKVLGSYPVAVL